MDYRECLNFLDGLGHELRGKKFGLEAITKLLAALGRPEARYPTAIVAGTNGKGSTCAMLANILQRAGYRTGLYTSPHLVRVNERIRINGREIADEDFASAFTEVSDQVERLLAENVFEHRPSFFEYLTATAFVHFARKQAGFVVLEVGMGGRLDATNVTKPAVALITNVELDHQEFLGSTHAAIAGEKAGVIKSGCPVICSCEHAKALEVIRQRCSAVGANLFETWRGAKISNLSDRGGRCVFDLELAGGSPLHLRLPLAGTFQVKNALAAVAAAEWLAQEGFDISAEAIEEGIASASWPGRLEAIHQRPLVLLDGAHNPAAAGELARYIGERASGRLLRLVYASMHDKAIEEITELLFPLAEEIYLTQCDVARAAAPEAILARTRVQPGKVFVELNPARALERAVQAASPEDVVLAAGSLFLVGAIKKAMIESPEWIGSLARAAAVS